MLALKQVLPSHAQHSFWGGNTVKTKVVEPTILSPTAHQKGNWCADRDKLVGSAHLCFYSDGLEDLHGHMLAMIGLIYLNCEVLCAKLTSNW